MELSQSDRDKLRDSQRRLNPQTVGNIVEHGLQDPKKYKQLSKREPGLDKIDKLADVPLVHYQGKYISNDRCSSLGPISELNSELPEDVICFQANSWLNMDQVEFDKLEWMSSKADKIYQESLTANTQFDKDGRAVIKDTVDKSEAKDSDLEAHDIESLTRLLDSAYDPQVTYALNVISKIANLSTMGHYDGSFDENIHSILLKHTLLRVRHHIDHTNETIRLSALKCLRSLICNTQIDEVILDRIFPVTSGYTDQNLWLQTIEMDSQNFTIEMKDLECVEIDVILALVSRTSIIERFIYLLEIKTGKIKYIYYDCILDILVRIARHSPEVCHLMVKKGVMNFVIQLFLPISPTTETRQSLHLAAKALKFLRIIAQASQETIIRHTRNSSQKIINIDTLEQIVPMLEAFFFIDCYSLPENRADQLMKLHIETLRIMRVLSSSKFFQSKMAGIASMCLETLHSRFNSIRKLSSSKRIESNISFDWQFAAHLIDLTGNLKALERCYNVPSGSSMNGIWGSHIRPIALQWLNDLVRDKFIPHIDVSIAIACCLMHYKCGASEYDCKSLITVLIDNIVNERKGIFKSNNLDLFKILARSASDKSQLTNFLHMNGRLRDPKSLPSFGCLNFNTSNEYYFKLNPLVDKDTPFILLNSFITELQTNRLGNQDSLKIFVENLDLNRYIRCVNNYHKYPPEYELQIQQSILAQFEVRVIGRALILLSIYYLEYKQVDDGVEGRIDHIEPEELAKTRIDCYSNLCYDTISILGLLFPSSEHVLEIKDILFEKVLLNSNMQKRIIREKYARGSDLEFDKGNLSTGEPAFKTLDSHYLNVLTPIYMSCEQPNRFWIFYPILEYYFRDLGERTLDSSKKKLWFHKNMSWRMHTGELISANDNDIVHIILTFNFFMIYYSPAYLNLVIKPSLEDYLCILGSIFLDDNLFLDEDVSQSLSCNLKLILNECAGKSHKQQRCFFTDATKIIEPLELPLIDFFNKLVDQFEAVSYGNIAFSNFILLFLTPNSDIAFRRKLFQEKSETTLGQLRMSPDNLWTPQHIFFVNEMLSDSEMTKLIRKSKPFIQSGSFLKAYVEFYSS